MTNNDYEFYKRRMRLKHKYSTLLDLNKVSCSASKIVRFTKRHLLVQPINLTQDEQNMIPAIYRFRCNVFDNDEIQMMNNIFDMQLQEIENNSDKDIIHALKQSIESERDNQIAKIKKNIAKIPVMLDLRIYGEYPDTPIFLDKQILFFDKNTKDLIKKLYNKVRPDSSSLERFQQMLEWSKVLSDIYNKSK